MDRGVQCCAREVRGETDLRKAQVFKKGTKAVQGARLSRQRNRYLSKLEKDIFETIYFGYSKMPSVVLVESGDETTS